MFWLWFQIQEGQDLCVFAVVEQLTFKTSSEHQTVYLSNKYTTKDFLRDFRHGSTVHGWQEDRTFDIQVQVRFSRFAINSFGFREFFKNEQISNYLLETQFVELLESGFRNRRFQKRTPWCFWGHNSVILVRDEITPMTLYHICKILYQWNLPTWYQYFCGTTFLWPVDGILWKNIEKSKCCEFVGVWPVKMIQQIINRVPGIFSLVQNQIANIYWKHKIRSPQNPKFHKIRNCEYLLETQNHKIRNTKSERVLPLKIRLFSRFKKWLRTNIICCSK